MAFISFGTVFPFDITNNLTKMKKVAIIGTAGVPARYGGFETLAENLVINWKDQFETTVYASKKYYSKKDRVAQWNGARIKYLPIGANGLASILYDIVSIIQALFYADYLLILGVSGGIILPLVRKLTTKKIIVNIDGLEWRRQKWSRRARVFLKISEKLAVKYSHADITDNASIQRYTAIYYQTLSYLVEYGGDHCRKENAGEDDKKKYSFLNTPYYINVSRVEPENNTHLILEAFSQVPQKKLVMVGNWERSDYGRQLKHRFASYPNITIMDPVYDRREVDMLRSYAQAYIHGHSAGGTNPSLVEAMFLGLPVISFDVSYNRATTENKAKYFRSADQLVKLLQKYHHYDLLRDGEIMKKIADRRYLWTLIAGKYARLVNSFQYDYRKRSVHSELKSVEGAILYKYQASHLSNTRFFFE